MQRTPGIIHHPFLSSHFACPPSSLAVMCFQPTRPRAAVKVSLSLFCCPSSVLTCKITLPLSPPAYLWACGISAPSLTHLRRLVCGHECVEAVLPVAVVTLRCNAEVRRWTDGHPSGIGSGVNFDNFIYVFPLTINMLPNI